MAAFSENISELCAALNRFALPRAVAHLRQNRFVAWTPSFRQRTGWSDETISKLDFDRAVRWGTVEAQAGSFVQFIGCTVEAPDGQRPVPGLVARRTDGYCYVMLDAVYPAGSGFQQGRAHGVEEERRHVEQVFMDDAGPKLLAAAFQVEVAKRQMEAHRLDPAPLVEASQALTEAIETLGTALEKKDGPEAIE